ncbi:MAG: SDR family NAD(P)-dependent oxidoreductase [Planctomycetota bacterium]
MGRGLILPGAQSVEEFAELLATGRSVLSEAPANRWRDRTCIDEGTPTPWHAPTCRGGFIENYAFDWQRHRVPPKQIAQANPLQFMLLDAARQALHEAGYEQREFDRTGTAVVVGTLFGGEFGHALVVGLRLPALRSQLIEILQGRGLPKDLIDRLVTEYEEALLRAKPALLDETGSFTSSTLASRLSKELNLMGGAMAVDAGECSSFAALDVACNLLRTGACSHVLAAGAQRSMDLANFEALALQGRLIGSMRDEPQAGYVPGEGVGIVLLKRLADAHRDGDRVLGVIREMAGASHGTDLSSAVSWAGERVLERSGHPASDVARITAGCNVSKLDVAEQCGLKANFGDEPASRPPSFISQIGHTMAAHGMVALIRDTLQSNENGGVSVVSNHAASGLAYQMLLDSAPARSSIETANGYQTSTCRTLRFSAESRDELRTRVERAASDAEPAFVDEVLRSPDAAHRMSIVARDAASLREKMNLALSQWERPDSRAVLAAQGIFYGVRGAKPPRVTFAFSGLGSQYPGMLQGLAQCSPAARAVLDEADVWLREVSGETFADLAWEDSDRLGNDIWATQATMLVAGVMSCAWLREAGVRPDCVCGHSFGEFAALVAAGVWTLEQAIRITWARSEALQANPGERGTLLSVQAEADQVQALIEEFAGAVSITHTNAPRQTVVGGTHDEINRFAELLAAKQMDCQPLPVPCAFHTPLMAASQPPLRAALVSAVLRPPTVPLLSNVSNRYVADPEEIRESLVQQLVAPVRYVELIQRLVNDGTSVLIEVGPRQVLTRLNGQILAESDVVCLSTDHSKRDCAEHLQCILAQLDCVGVEAIDNRAQSPAVRALAIVTLNGHIEHFDATLNRKGRLRDRASTGEAELGIDAEQTTKLVGELRTFFAPQANGNGHVDSHDMRERFSTLHQLLENLQQAGSSNGRTDASKNGANATAASGEEVDDLEQFLVSFVVEHTGYPPQIIQLDADFEADLGIDSIKKAQLFGELREHFSLQVEGQDRFALAKFRTLRHVLDLLREVTRNEPAPQAIAARVHAAPAETLAAKSQPAAKFHDVEVVCGTAVDRESAAFRQGFSRGHLNAQQIQHDLRDAADRQEFTDRPIARRTNERFTREQWDEMHGLADGARVHVGSIAARNLAQTEDSNGAQCLLAEELDEPLAKKATRGQRQASDVLRPQTEITRRHVLTMAPSPQLHGAPETPVLAGASLVLGTGPVAEALRTRIVELGQPVHILTPGDDPVAAVAELNRLWEQGPLPHLFIVTGHESDVATSFELPPWQRRRARGIMTPFWVCQRWIRLVTDANLMDDASLVGATSLGGDFGFSGNVGSAEGGAIAGLLKSIIIESWMNGFRTIPIKLIDSPANEEPAAIVDGIMRELAVPSYDVEIGWSQGRRSVVRAVAEPLKNQIVKPIKEGGNWVLTGGGRGITAHVAFELGKRYGLELHLIGTAPQPDVPDAWRDMSDDALSDVKLNVMMSAQKAGRNPIKAWEQAEKAIEIDATLRHLADAGISARYYSCDVADREALAAVLDEIRETSGPIDGVLHGAGIGKDARFENKQPDKVDQCIRAKVDGTLALMDLTRDDPLKHFVAFGSISGRFGANGHTDYSLANDMTAKLVDWYRGQRPEVAAVAFHWHAWGDVGMATKPETRLALEMIGMQFMPAAEGVEHLIRELENGAPQGEVLITDDKYYRLFYPAETLDQDDASAGGEEARYPLLDRGVTAHEGGREISSVVLDPTVDPFLIEHRLDDRPLLPLVIGLEFLCEAAAHLMHERGSVVLRDVEAVNGLRFHTDQSHVVRVRTVRMDQTSAACELVADVNTRDGKRVEENRVYLRGIVEASQLGQDTPRTKPVVPDGPWHPVEYPALGSKFYLGPPLRCLRKIQFGEQVAWGQMIAPAIVELAGPQHPVAGWMLPSAALDACLYATGLLAWFAVEPGSALPASIGRLTLGRLPRAGESCLVETRFRSREGRYGLFDFTLFGVNGEVIMEVSDYRIVWLQ